MTAFVYTVHHAWPDEGTKVLVATVEPETETIACHEGEVVEAGAYMRIEFWDHRVVMHEGKLDIDGFKDSVYRMVGDRGTTWCIDDNGEEAAAFRAATTMAG